jgi:dihydroorotate dehydrogenase (fumarate)
MIDLSVQYLGLKLKNPLVLAACGLGASLDKLVKASNAGIGAVVLKSLFEEQLRAELAGINDEVGAHPEAANFLQGMGLVDGAAWYFDLIADARRNLDLPVIASLNGTSGAWWPDYAKNIQKAGASALEMNIGHIPASPDETATQIEQALVDTVASVCQAVTIPVAVKIGQGFTNPLNLAVRLAKAGARGLVLFNRFYRMDIDLDTMSLKPGPTRSNPESFHDSLRWLALMDGRAPLDLAASGGVYDGQSAIKLIAAGATAVQLCSAVYSGGFPAITAVLDDMTHWMESRKVDSFKALHGHLSRRNAARPELYGRLHYIKALVGIE